MSYVIRKERCPACELRGVDRSGDNLGVYSDGHSWCFGCGYYVPATLSSRIGRASEDQTLVLPSFSENDLQPTSKQPPSYVPQASWPKAPREWLSKYGITSKEIYDHRIYWDEKEERLVFPIYYGHILTISQGRYFGSDPRQPRYLTSGPKSSLYKIFQPPAASPVLVLVEDYLSAIKVSRTTAAIPLLGSHYSSKLILALLGRYQTVRLWLDFDKKNEAVKLASITRQYIPDCGTIITEKDPKDYSTMEIKDLVSASLRSHS